MVQTIDGSSGATGTGSASQSQYAQAMKDAMTAVEQKLGMSSSALQTALQGGQTLSQIATSKGVSASDLQSTIQTALKADLPNASASQLAKMTSRIEGGHSHHHHGSSSSASSSSSSDASSSASTSETSLDASLVSLEAPSSATTGSSSSATSPSSVPGATVSLYA